MDMMTATDQDNRLFASNATCNSKLRPRTVFPAEFRGCFPENQIMVFFRIGNRVIKIIEAWQFFGGNRART